MLIQTQIIIFCLILLRMFFLKFDINYITFTLNLLHKNILDFCN